jgi:SAM-dependent MidA family methyltransferase
VAGAPRSSDPDALRRAIVDHVEASGPIGFDEYVAHALYTPELGFYQRGGGAGRRRDFLTSPEVGPLFGAVIARALDSWWDGLGRPETFALVEAGAGPGTLARTVLAASPRCAPALDLVLVEPGTVQWEGHPLGASSRVDLPSADELGGSPVVVLANELLDNLPFGLAELTASGWNEVRVGVDPAERSLVEVPAPLDPARVAWCHHRAPDAPVGSRIPVQSDAASWLTEALGLVAASGAGRVVAIDYASTSSEMAARPPASWLRTYASHGHSGPPLELPGSSDITCEVAVDQLALVRPPDRTSSQSDFLRSHGLDELVEEGRRRWEATGLSGGLDAVAGRSRVHEAEALTDDSGLGGFTVLEWVLTVRDET